MKYFQPYTIRQLTLADWPSWLEELRKGPLYAVVWHKEIPLGDFYVNAGETLSREALLRRIKNSIQPTLKHYQKQAPADSWNALWEEGSFSRAHVLDTLLAKHVPESLPNEVPVSAIICTRHRPGQLAACLASLRKLPCRPAEIIVVDNGPDDPATAAQLKEFPEVSYLAEPRPGLDRARNAGLRAASQPVLAFIDDDVHLHALWAYRVWEAFEDPSVAALTGLVLAAELTSEAQLIFERYWSFNRGFRQLSYNESFLKETLQEGPPVWKIGAGANMAFRRSILPHTGLFDERLDAGAAGCNGDSEMWFRILKAGYTIAYEPKAVVWHQHRTHTEALQSQLYQYMRGFTVACLLQQRQLPQAGYERHLSRVLPAYYLHLLRRGFPFYRGRFSTLWPEMRGVWAGRSYYRQHCQDQATQPPQL